MEDDFNKLVKKVLYSYNPLDVVKICFVVDFKAVKQRRKANAEKKKDK